MAFEKTLFASLILGMVASPLLSQERQGRAEVLAAAANHVRFMLAQEASEFADSAGTADGHLLIDLTSSRDAEGLEGLRDVIGNSAISAFEEVDHTCRSGSREDCPLSPVPVGMVQFHPLEVDVSPTTAQVSVSLLLFPPARLKTGIIYRKDRIFLARRDGSWYIVDYQVLLES